MKNIVAILVLISLSFTLSSCWKSEEVKLAEKWEKLMEQAAEGNMENLAKNNTKESDIPSWLYDLWFKKPSWLDFVWAQSEVLSEKGASKFNSVNLYYTTDSYEKAISETEKLAKSMWIEEWDMSPRIMMKATQEALKWLWMPEEENADMQDDMSWAMFVNCVLWFTCKEGVDYAKMINLNKVWDLWELNINIVNYEQWAKIMNSYTG